MVLEIVAFVVEGGADSLVGLDITLATIDDGNVAKAQRNDTSSENIYDIRAFVPIASITVSSCSR